METRSLWRDTTIPTQQSHILPPAADSQPSVDVNVLQGERAMAKDHTKLGTFHLDGIPAAPRGVPQSEVTFDIDANGIVAVSAKDLGTGKEQSITITTSTNMSKDDVEKAVKEAEQYAEEDRKLKEKIEVRNAGDQMVYQTEKTIGDLGDKMEEADKTSLTEKKDALKKALEGEDLDDIKAKQEELQKALHEVSTKVYSANSPEGAPEGDFTGQQAEGGAAEAGSAPAGDDVIDADFTEVDE